MSSSVTPPIARENKARPTVSVIIATHDRAALLAEALHSVLGQDRSDFEVIVVDDGSTGGARTVVDSFADPRIRYVAQPSAGRSSARNLGIGMARGDFISFLDDDDLWLPHKLSRQLALLNSHPHLGVIGTGALLIDARGNQHGTWFQGRESSELSLVQALYAFPLMPSTVMIRSSVFAAKDQWFDPEMELGEDKDLFARLLAAGVRAAFFAEPHTLHRIHAGNSQGDGQRYMTCNLRSLDKLYRLNPLPAELSENKSALYAYYYLTGGLHALATGQIDVGRLALQHALVLDPELIDGETPMFVECVAAFADSVLAHRPHAFINLVFDSIPNELARLRLLRNRTRGTYHMGRVFRAHAAGCRIGLDDWVLGTYFQPRWLRNRGVWSILIRQLLRMLSTVSTRSARGRAPRQLAVHV